VQPWSNIFDNSTQVQLSCMQAVAIVHAVGFVFSVTLLTELNFEWRGRPYVIAIAARISLHCRRGYDGKCGHGEVIGRIMFAIYIASDITLLYISSRHTLISATNHRQCVSNFYRFIVDANTRKSRSWFMRERNAY
jgi:hypothetical protein